VKEDDIKLTCKNGMATGERRWHRGRGPAGNLHLAQAWRGTRSGVRMGGCRAATLLGPKPGILRRLAAACSAGFTPAFGAGLHKAMRHCTKARQRGPPAPPSGRIVDAP